MIDEIINRRSIRKYKDKQVSDEDINQIINSAILAPSGSNTQPWNFIIIKSREVREKVREVCHNQKWMDSAPVFIVCVADIRCRLKDDDIRVDENSSQHEVKQIIRDTSFAIENILLNANNLKLGTCCVAWFLEDEIRKVLNIPNDKYVVAVIALGYPDEVPEKRPRKGIKEVIHYEKW